LSEKFGCKVSVGNVNLGFLNRFIIDDVEMYDKQGKKMVRIARLSAKLDLESFKHRELGIGSVQLFGFNGDFYRDTPESQPNYQFVIDSLASKDTNNDKTFLSYHLNDVIIRHGQVKYNVLSEKPKVEAFDVNHLSVNDISTHFKIRHISSDSIDVEVKKMSMTEQSGLDLRKLSFDLTANKGRAMLKDFTVQLPHSNVEIKQLDGLYKIQNGKLDIKRLRYNLREATASIQGKDIAPLIPALKGIDETVNLKLTAKGAEETMKATADISTASGSEIRTTINARDVSKAPRWDAEIHNLLVSTKTTTNISNILNNSNISLPPVIEKIGNVKFQGQVRGKGLNLDEIENFVNVDGKLTTDLGNADLAAQYKGTKEFQAKLTTDGIDLQKLSGNDKLGTLAADVETKGKLENGKLAAATLKGDIDKATYNGKEFQNIHIDGQMNKGVIDGLLTIDDPDVKAKAQGKIDINKGIDIHDLTADVEKLDPYAAGLLKDKGNGGYVINDLTIRAGTEKGEKYMNLNSQFLTASLKGQYDYPTLHQSIINLIGNKLPTLPGLPATNKEHNNNFTLNATLTDTEWLNKMFGVPLKTDRPTDITASIDDNRKTMTLHTQLPWLSYDGKEYRDTHIDITTPGDTLVAHITTNRERENSKPLGINLIAKAIDNHLDAKAVWKNNSKKKYDGEFNCQASFAKDAQGRSTATINVLPSQVFLNDTAWQVEPAVIKYRKKHIDIDGLKIQHGQQHLMIAGTASEDPADSLVANLNKINVEYVMNIVNFHSVDFGGMASGKAVARNIFGTPQLFAKLAVEDFLFEHGNLGTLYADAAYNNALKQIDINAHADESLTAQTLVNGYVSPEREDIDLRIEARNTNGDFAMSFCNSFMSDIDAKINGVLNLVGKLDNMQLLGEATISGTTSITPLGTTYTLKNDTIKFIPDDIQFNRQVFYDKDGNTGIISGGLHHKHLTNLTFNIDVEANNLLCYDFKELGDDTFCGTVYGDGKASIAQKGNDILIDVDVTPKKNTLFIYDASSPEAVTGDEFIKWNTIKETTGNNTESQDEEEDKPQDIPANIYMNLLINCNQDATMKLLMDKQTNDYIALNGDGVIRAAFYNKGTLDLYGTYIVDHGIYKLTIQNVIKKDFQFLPEGTIIFGGDPMKADLNLKAQYTVNGVSLSDLDPSNTFSSNTIRVNCLMNIHGHPEQPEVDFDLELPTVNSDEQQMVRAILNGKENMNQQVLYLLAIGRFYNDGSNNAAENSSNSQTNRAMQSIFSGALSSQINNVLSSVINDNNWNFGANISTGTEGWNNAEYEGLVSGRLLNNRLLINGQFGYKDNAATANQSFVGDFDVRYLFNPRGTFALKVYNQTNDRYFTKSSLNTQGIGIIVKKDFTRLSDIFRKKPKRKVVPESGDGSDNGNGSGKSNDLGNDNDSEKGNESGSDNGNESGNGSGSDDNSNAATETERDDSVGKSQSSFETESPLTPIE